MPTAKGTKHNRRTEDLLVGRLKDGLADEEMWRVLACSLLELDADGKTRMLERLDKETSSTLTGLLEPASPAKTSGKRVEPGKAKIKQDWNTLWSRWDTLLAEASKEGGRYVIQEDHWEAPFFDLGQVSMDLEQIAAQMRPLIPLVWKHNLQNQRNLMEELDQFVEEMGEAPDWMQRCPESLELGPQLTSCVLSWAEQEAEEDEMGAVGVVETLCGFSVRKELILDDETLVDFIKKLSEQDIEELKEDLSDGWEKSLENDHSRWAEQLRKAVGRPNKTSAKGSKRKSR